MAKLTRETLVEYVTSPQTLRVDRENGFLAEVKVLGLQSANGRRYEPEGIRKAIDKYEGRQVNIDHGARSSESRSARDRFGWLEGVHLQADGLYAKKLHFLKSHAMAGPVAEAAERNPALFALSHNAIGNSRRENGSVVVESIEEVLSVDVVADGATCRSLREGKNSMKTIKQLLESLSAAKTRPAALKLLEDDYAPMMDKPVDVPDEMSADETGVEAMAAMVKAAVKEGDWKKAHEIVKAFEKLLSEKETPEEEGEKKTEGESEGEAKEALKQKEADEMKKLQESYDLRIKARDLAADAGVNLTAGRRRVLDACTSEKEITEAIKDFTEEAPAKPAGQKPKSGPRGGQSNSHRVQESKNGQTITVPDSVKDGKSLAEWARS